MISQDKLDQAITQIRPLLQSSKALQQLIIQSARYVDISDEIRNGTVSRADAGIEKNKIRKALIEIVLQLEEGKEHPSVQQELEPYLNAHQVHSGSGDNVLGDKNTMIVKNDGARIGQQNNHSEVDNSGTSFNIS